MIQVIVMLMLAVPACCYELGADHEMASISQTAKASTADHDNCPCCPGENSTDADGNNCSACSYCSCYVPLLPVVSATYAPSATQLTAPEQFTMLTDVHRPIFVPPQNLT